MVNFLPEVVDGLDQELPLGTVVLELLLEFWRFEELLFEIQLPIKISSLAIETRPHIIDAISEAFQLLARNRQLLDNTMLKSIALESDQLL